MYLASVITRGAFALILGLIIAGTVAWEAVADERPVPDHPDVHALSEFFGDVALGKDPGARIVKWAKAPSVRLETLISVGDGTRSAVGETSPVHYQALARHVMALAALSTLPIRLLPRDIGRGGDIVITVVPRTLMRHLDYPGVSERQLQRLMGPGRCYFLAWPDRNWHLTKARIVINSLLPENHINHCLLEELSQTLGLPNDSERVRPSVFNESEMLTRLAVADEVLIRTLYDPRLIAGARRGDVIARLDDIIRAYLPSE